MIIDDHGMVPHGAQPDIYLLSDWDVANAGELVAAAPQLVSIEFASFADGRGFTIARTLRSAGYRGRLRAAGHLLADQYGMARRSGFDEVEISQDLARRQDEAQWRARSSWREHDYQSRLGRRHAVVPRT